MAETRKKAQLARGTTPRLDLAFPYRIADHGETAMLRSPLQGYESAGGDRHLRDLLEQLLFTSPGERVMRPDFGSGLERLVFEPSGAALAVALQAQMQAVILQYLGDRLELEALEGRRALEKTRNVGVEGERRCEG